MALATNKGFWGGGGGGEEGYCTCRAGDEANVILA